MADKLPFTIRIKAFSLYLFFLFLIYLARSYLGFIFIFFFYMALFFPIGSLLYLLIAAARIRYHQEFSTEHPVKGQTVTYRLTLTNESPLPIPYLIVHFKPVNPFMERITTDFSTYLGRYGITERKYEIQLPFRGIYTVGLDNLVFEDLFHLFRITRSVWYRTFYVYPRILYLNRFPYILKGGTQKTHGTFQGTVPDLSLFTQLKAYRSGESLRHICWKKFASTGIPFLREYEITTEPGLTIYVDLRRGTHIGINALKIEDTSIEILVSLVKYFLDQGIRIIIRAPGRNLYSFTGNNRIQFNDFYTSTFQLLFQKTISPAKLYRADRKSGFQSSSSLFITHLMDADLFAFIEESLGMKNTISVIFNHAGCEDQDVALQYFNRLRDRGAKILVVRDSDSIVEDLGAIRA